MATPDRMQHGIVYILRGPGDEIVAAAERTGVEMGD
jgi:hypothetical protein